MFDRAAADQGDIETDIRPAPILMIGKRGIGGIEQPGLLPRQYRIGRLGKVFAGFHLNENQR